MRGIWAGSLSVALGLALGHARAEEPAWRPVVATLGAPVAASRSTSSLPAVYLGKPVPSAQPTSAQSAGISVIDQWLAPTAYSTSDPLAPPPTVRGQAPDYAPPSLAPAPPPGSEPFNCGVVTTPPASGHPWFGCLKDLFCCGGGSSGGRCCFQSDHNFDGLISPMTNPFLFEDPRALTEVRPIFIYQSTPLSSPIYHGGDIVFFGMQARVAFTDYLSLVINRVGYVSEEPHNAWANPLGSGQFDPHTGFSEVWLGPKWTFLRCESTRTLGAAGLTFQIPTGPSKVFQDTGSLSLTPYLSLEQSFFKTSYGSFNAINTVGYTGSTNNSRTDYVFDSIHLDYDVGNLQKVYPFIEASWFNYTSAGKQRSLGFEGRDLFNFGASGVSGNNAVSLAGGARYRFNECIQTGVAGEWGVGSHRDLLDFRLTWDMIFRY